MPYELGRKIWILVLIGVYDTPLMKSLLSIRVKFKQVASNEDSQWKDNVGHRLHGV